MYKLFLTTVILAITPVAANAVCDNPKASFIHDKPLPKKPDKIVDVENPVSAEGGEFYVYFGRHKKPESIVRYDYGETFRIITTLSIGAPKDVYLARTKEIYNIPFPLAGSKTIRAETDYFDYCGDRPKKQSDPEFASDDPAPVQAAIDEAFKVDEILATLKASGLKPLTSQ
jgi:hypothetical protein